MLVRKYTFIRYRVTELYKKQRDIMLKYADKWLEGNAIFINAGVEHRL